MRLSELIKGIYPKALPAVFKDFEVLTVSCDSREEQKDGLFVALSGAKFKGEDFIKEAIGRGARVVVRRGGCSGRDSSPFGLRMTDGDGGRMTDGREEVCVLEVEEPREFLKYIGPRFYGFPSGKIRSVGVTGTNGKTTVTYLIESIIHAAGQRCGVIGTVNYRIGEKILPSKNTTPGFLDNQRYLAQLAALKVDYCVMEASSHALDQGRLEGIDFSAGIFTNLTQDHLDYHKNMEEYFNAKSLLFKHLSPVSAAIINADDPYGKRLVSMTGGQVMTYAIDGLADVRAEGMLFKLSGSDFDIVFPRGCIHVHTPFIGKHNVYNMLAAFAWGLSQHLPLEIIRAGLENLACVPGRLEKVANDKGIFIFIDYAHTEDGLVNVLKALRAVSAEKIILVFGCGGDRDRAKRPKMAEAACRMADYSIVTSDNPRSEEPQAIIDEIITGFTEKNFEICLDRKEAIGRALHLAQRNQVVLIAGKGHEDYQIFKDRTIAFDEREIVREVLCLPLRKS